MSAAPSVNPRIVVWVSLRAKLDAEAYAARLARDPRFRVETSHSEPPNCDVWLTDRCDSRKGGEPRRERQAVVLVDPVKGGANGAACACCRRVSRSADWPTLLRALTEAAGVSDAPGAEPPNELATLSPREHEVLCLVGRGLTVPECAAELGLSASTIGNHKYRLMRKLGVTTSLQLLRIAVKNGLAEIE